MEHKWKRIPVRIVKALICVVMSLVWCSFSSSYLQGSGDAPAGILRVIGWLLIFTCIPVAFFVLYIKDKAIKWYSLVSLIIIIPCTVYIYVQSVNPKSFDRNSFDTYLENGTDFEEVASGVMPSHTSLDDNLIVFYEFSHYSDKMLRLTAICSQEDFTETKAALKAQFENQGDYYRETFYLDGELYHSYAFYDGGDAYAMAYSIDADERKISYMLYESENLQYMTLADALSLYYDKHRVHSVLSAYYKDNEIVPAP